MSNPLFYAIIEMEKCTNALYLQVPETVAHKVKKVWDDVKEGILHAHNADDWIPVETLPEEDGRYMVYDPAIFGDNKIEIYHYSKTNKCWYVSGKYYDPTHWRRLPNKPK
jgi:hypothetical protein